MKSFLFNLLKVKHPFLIPIIAFCLLNTFGLFFITTQIDAKLSSVQQTLKNSQARFESESRTTQSISREIQDLKKNYDKLKELLNKEVSFKEGLKFVFAFEGGVSDDAGDIGGLTNLGITHTEYDEYRASIGLPRRSVVNISLAEATDIYKHKYWLLSGCSDTPRRIAISCFDWQVNSNRGMTTLQRVLGVVADGVAGHDTLNELAWWLTKPQNEDRLLHNYFERREDAYRRWGVGSQAKFLQGWLRRSEALKNYLGVP